MTHQALACVGVQPSYNLNLFNLLHLSSYPQQRSNGPLGDLFIQHGHLVQAASWEAGDLDNMVRLNGDGH